MKKDIGIIDRAWDVQHKIEAKQQRIGKGKYGRVLKMARKPTNEEYEKTSKITGVGILVVGAIGFVIYIIKELAVPWILSALGY
ncbi:MAG: protein translocase SEC61 complex subunit gamma [Atribacterota bacterium]